MYLNTSLVFELAVHICTLLLLDNAIVQNASEGQKLLSPSNEPKKMGPHWEYGDSGPENSK